MQILYYIEFLAMEMRKAPDNDYPAISFIIKSSSAFEEIEAGTALFNEIVADLKKRNLPFKVEVTSGSLEFSVQILVDFIKESLQNPSIAAALGGAVSGAVGSITQKILDRKNSVSKTKVNASWRFSLKIKLLINRNLDKKLDSISTAGNAVKLGFKGEGGKTYQKSYKRTFKKSNHIDKEIESEIIRRIDDIGTQDLILMALLLRKPNTKSEIKAILEEWGKVFGSWFEGANFSARLVKAGLVRKADPSKEGADSFVLTKKGEMEAEQLIKNIRDIRD
jgi:hypothetical protein